MRVSDSLSLVCGPAVGLNIEFEREKGDGIRYASTFRKTRLVYYGVCSRADPKGDLDLD